MIYYLINKSFNIIMKILILILFLASNVSSDYNNLLFTSINKNYINDKLDVIGTIPNDINHIIYRNGFGKFEGYNFTFNHLFDSLSLIIKINISNNSINFTSRILESKYYNDSQKEIPLYRTLGGTIPNMTNIEKDITLIHFMHDNLNANIINISNKLFAISDLAGHILINNDDLKYINKYKFKNDKPLNIITSTHPIKYNNYIYNYEADIINNKYVFYYIDTINTLEKIYFMSIDTKYFSYIHSFSITNNYIIFIEYPLYWNIDKIITSVEILPTLIWMNNKTKINIIDYKNKIIYKTYYIEPIFSFHHINSYEEDNKIIIDLITYPNSKIFDYFYLDKLKNSNIFPVGKYTRININLLNNMIDININNNINIEMPIINDNIRGYKYEYFYCFGYNNIIKEMSIIKYNVLTNEYILWNKYKHIPSEPIYIETEKNKYLVSIVLDEINKNSKCIIIDANNMTEIAYGNIPTHIPLTCHGFVYKL